MKTNTRFLVMMLLVVACGQKQPTESEGESKKVTKVKTEIVRAIKGVSELRYSGTVEPSQTIPLSFQSAGIVETVLIQEGDIVRKGQLLATVDKADNESVYSASVSKYNQAKDAYDRLKSVHDNGSLPEIKWVEMETNLKQTESQVQIARSNLEKCNMRSPDNGMIGSRNVEPGQSVISTRTPIELVKIDNVLVKVAVPENEISKIKKGQKATLSISALEGKSFEGEVTNVGIVADKISRTYEVKITVKNISLEIKPGMVCDVLVNSGSKRYGTIISYNSVSKDEEGNAFVYVVTSDGKAVKKQNITVGNYNEAGVEVVHGLLLGNIIVSEGKEKLFNNSLICL
jgi:RND family efflux transporter MFP subunit